MRVVDYDVARSSTATGGRGARPVQVQSKLIEVTAPAQPEGVVVVLHGGGARRGQMMVSPTQLSVLRMIPVAARIARATRGRVAVFRLLNSVRGWDVTHTPVQDARWAMEQLKARFGDVPVCLVGHSLGGRAALLAAGSPGVVSVVALAPWVYPQEGGDVAGRHIVILHGTKDRIASIKNAESVAQRLAATNVVSFVRVVGGKHAMLAHHRTFGRLAAEFASATLLPGASTGVMSRILDGEWLDL